MKLLKHFFYFYINSSLHVALAVCALVRITELYLNLKHNTNLELFIFFGTIFSYNYTKYNYLNIFNIWYLVSGKVQKPELNKYFKIGISIFSIVCLFISLYFGLKLKMDTLLVAFVFSFFVLFYNTTYQKSLRNIPSLKIFIIALSWVVTTVILPYISVHKHISNTLVLLSIQRFLFILCLTLPFDIRDYMNDPKNLKTIPQLIGIKHTKILGIILLSTSLILELLITVPCSYKLIFVLTLFILAILLQKASSKQSVYYCSFWVEAIPIFWYLISIL